MHPVLTNQGMAVQQAKHLYFWTVSVVVAAVPVSACTTTGRSPFAAPLGTCTLIWYTPAVPGTTPANDTVAAAPPIVTWGSVASGDAAVGTTPGICAGVVAPNPVPNNETVSP